MLIDFSVANKNSPEVKHTSRNQGILGLQNIIWYIQERALELQKMAGKEQLTKKAKNAKIRVFAVKSEVNSEKQVLPS